MNGAAVIQLPLGFREGGSRYLEAVVRPLTGEDQEFLLEEAASSPPAQRATALLGRCTVRLGPVSPVSEPQIRGLCAGDREALLLHLRRITFGDRAQSTVECPEPGCGQRIDLDFRIRDLLLPASTEAPASYQDEFAAGPATYRVRFRLPTGADQEAAVEAAGGDVARGVRALLARCVESCEPPPEGWPPPLVEGISQRMAQLDPQAQVELAAVCPSCGAEFETLLDAATFLFDEVGLRLAHLYREVHLLALHYHWSEAEILRMTPGKRRRYLNLLEESLGEEWNA